MADEWNHPNKRASAIAEFSSSLLASTLRDELEFVDYPTFVNDADYVTGSGQIHIATIEFDAVWDQKKVYIPYEQLMVRYRQMQLVPHRIFLLNAGQHYNPGYRMMFFKVLHRHRVLELNPRIAIYQDLQKHMRQAGFDIKCQALATVNLDYALLIKVDTGREPAMLKVNNKSFCERLDNFLFNQWKKANPVEHYEHEIDALPPELKREAEQEAEYIEKTCPGRSI